jgi:hypothetical protein
MMRTTTWQAWRQCLPRRLLAAAASARPRPGVRPSFATTSQCFASTLSGRGGSSSDRDPRVGKGGSKSKVTGSDAKLLTALRAYKEKHEDLLVPQTFTVPAGDAGWPADAWGYNLGAAVNRVRGKLKHEGRGMSAAMTQELDDMDFVRDVFQFRWDRIFLPSLRRFLEVNGHTDVPKVFVVPIGDETWPKVAWGVRLGGMVDKVRCGKAYAAQIAESKEELERLQFCYKTSIAERDWVEKILPSVRVHRQEFGHCIVPQSFVVPASSPWPEKAWEMHLGYAINRIRAGSCYAEQVTRYKAILDELGFAWDWSAAVWNEEIIPALDAFAEVYKGRRFPSTFVVPSENPWPSRVWGMQLGAAIHQLRSIGNFFAHYGREFEKLEGLGMNMKLATRAWKLRVVPLLEIHEALNGDQEVPESFVIPSEAPWPEEMWGVRLGLIVARNLRHVQRG